MILSILAKPVFTAPAIVLALAAMSLPGWAQDVVEGADDPGYSEPGEGIDGELTPSDDQLIWIDDPIFVPGDDLEPGDDVIWIDDPGLEPGDGDMTDDGTDDGATGDDDIIWLDDPALYDGPIALDGSDCGGCEYQTTGGITPAEIRTGSGSGASSGVAPASGGGDMCQILPWKNMWICEIQAGAALQ